MKKRTAVIISLMLSFVLLLSFASCSPARQDENDSSEPVGSEPVSSEEETAQSESGSSSADRPVPEEEATPSVPQEESQHTSKSETASKEESASSKPEISSGAAERPSQKPEKPSQNPEKPSQKPEEPSQKPEEPDAPRYGLATDDLPRVSKPILTGDFIQSWFCRDWTVGQWQEHFKELKAVGITSLILQSTFDITDQGAFSVPKATNISFKHQFDAADADNANARPYCLGRMLTAAKREGCTVWIGLGSPDGWWKGRFVGESWRNQVCKLNQSAMKTIKDTYYADYRDQIAGFYWTPEMYTQGWKNEKHWAVMLNSDLDFLTGLKTGLPMMVAPFNSGGEIKARNMKPADTEAMWTRFFSQTRFRRGDVFCPQDCMHSQKLGEENGLAHLMAMQRACQKSGKGIRFWVDVESFTDDFNSADINRYIRQLEICSKLAENMVGFSYSHYYATVGKGTDAMRNSYRAHYEQYKG